MGDYYREILNVPLTQNSKRLLKYIIITMFLERNGKAGYIFPPKFNAWELKKYMTLKREVP